MPEALRSGSARRGEVEVAGGFAQFEGGDDLPLFGGGKRALDDGSLGAGEGDEVHVESSLAMLRRVSPTVFSTTRMISSASQHS